MINFRFHLVSITAIFLALAAGIAIGAAVVDQGSVNLLRTQLDEVEARRKETNTRNDELKASLDEWQRYAQQADLELVEGHLGKRPGGDPVLIVAVEGVDRAQVAAFDAALAAAGARRQGTVWLSPKWAVEGEGAAADLARALGVGTNLSGETLRRAAIARLGRALLDGDPLDLLVALQGAGFVDHLAPDDATPLAAVPTADATVVVVSGPGAAVPNRALALPLVEVMATTGKGFIAAQPGRPVPGDDPDPFVASLRGRPEPGGFSTVDSLDDHRGRTAAVLAVEALLEGIRGHYGLGVGAERILPQLPVSAPR